MKTFKEELQRFAVVFVLVQIVLPMAVPRIIKKKVAPLEANSNSSHETQIHQTSDIFDTILKVNSKISTDTQAGGIAEDLFQGDIVFTRDILLALKNSDTDTLTLPPRDAVARAVDARNQSMWPVVNGRVQVPYVIDQSSAANRSIILQAMNHWSDKVSCIVFVPRTTQADYLTFFAGQGCFSWVGRTGGNQRISIGTGCAVLGVIVHEIGHALGFWHEQSRPDRDKYVKILWDNILPGKEGDFKIIKNTNDHSVPYDLSSVMHYGPKAFSKSKTLNTIESLDGSTDFGQRNGLSDKDIQQAKLLYCSRVNVCLHKDKSTHCAWWAEAGYCHTSSIYHSFMNVTCKRSCHCSFVCEDKNVNCPALAGTGSLCTDKRHKKYMSLYCKKSCRMCQA